MTSRPDNWGGAARIGIFIVGAEAVPEAEWWAMAPPGVSVHAARVSAPAPWVKWEDTTGQITPAPDIERGAAHFRAMALSAVVLAHSTSSIVGGAGWDAAVIDGLRPYLDETTAITTNGLDCTLALRKLGVERPFLVFPPWFGDGAVDAGRAYFEAQGFHPAHVFRHVPEARWQGIAPHDLYGARMHVAQNADLLHDQILAECPNEADGMLIVGTGLRCVRIIEATETTLNRPLVTANQASLWRCLSLAGVASPIQGYGRLLSGPRLAY